MTILFNGQRVPPLPLLPPSLLDGLLPDFPLVPLDDDLHTWVCVCERCRECLRPHGHVMGSCHVAISTDAKFLFCCEREWISEMTAELLFANVLADLS
jgi:hypothetical protein